MSSQSKLVKSLPSKKLSKLIATAVLHHQDGVLTGEFSPQVNRIDDRILNTRLEDLLKETEPELFYEK